MSAKKTVKSRRPTPAILRVDRKIGGALVLRANRVFRREMKHLDTSARESAIREHLTEGWGLCLDDGGRVAIGLTEAPFIADATPDYDSDARMLVLPAGANVWWFPGYALADFTETLCDEGSVTFVWGMTVEYEGGAEDA